MRRDHRPYYIKKASQKFSEFYVNHFLRPQLESLGRGAIFVKPWYVKFFGSAIELGDYVNVVASADRKVSLGVWSAKETQNKGRIQIGDYCLVCPGVRIGSAHEITIGRNSMIASGAYITEIGRASW